jgi:chromosome segregation ATPase
LQSSREASILVGLMNTNELLEKIGNLLHPIRQQLYEQGANIVRLVQGQKRLESRTESLAQGQSELKQGQAQTDTTLSRISTAVEALKAGQDDIQEQLATKADKADILDLKAEVVKKVKQHDKRLDTLEEKAGISNPYRN